MDERAAIDAEFAGVLSMDNGPLPLGNRALLKGSEALYGKI